LQDGDLVLTQGAGDIGKIARHLQALALNIKAMQH
jgi:UDP-N-acetylmuramate--alanine ligase